MLKSKRSINKKLRSQRRIEAENVLVLWASNCDHGADAANYYSSVRGVPSANLVEIPMAWTPTDGTVMSEADTILSHAAVMNAYTSNHSLKCCVIMGFFPTLCFDAALGGGPIHYDGMTIGELFGYPYFMNNRWDAIFNFQLDDEAIIFPHRFPLDDALEFAPSLFSTYDSEEHIDRWSNNILHRRFIEGDYTVPIFGTVLPYRTWMEGDQYGSTDGTNTSGTYRPIPATGRPDFNNLRNNLIEEHLYFPVHHLSVSPSATGEDSELVYIKRIIDDSIQAESLKYHNFDNTYLEGNADAQGVDADTYVFGRYPHSELNACGILNTDSCFWNNVDGFYEKIGLYTFGEDTLYPLADNLPAGCTSTVRKRTGTWVDQLDVFFRSTNKDAYIVADRPIDDVDDFRYKKGAIVITGRSLGAVPNPVETCHPDFGVYTINNVTGENAKNRNQYDANVSIITPLGFTGGIASISYTGASTAATITIASNVLTIFENGVFKGVLNITAGTPRAMVEQIYTFLTSHAGWTISYDGSFWNLTDIALKNGAAAAHGAVKEPYSNNASNPKNWIWSLFLGKDNMAELSYKIGPSGSVDISSVGGTDGVAYHTGGLVMYADPLYRPFGHL